MIGARPESGSGHAHLAMDHITDAMNEFEAAVPLERFAVPLIGHQGRH